MTPTDKLELATVLENIRTSFLRMTDHEQRIEQIARSLTTPPVIEGGPWDGRAELREIAK